MGGISAHLIVLYRMEAGLQAHGVGMAKDRILSKGHPARCYVGRYRYNSQHSGDDLRLR